MYQISAGNLVLNSLYGFQTALLRTAGLKVRNKYIHVYHDTDFTHIKLVSWTTYHGGLVTKNVFL